MRVKRGTSVLPENRPPFTKGKPSAQWGKRGRALARSAGPMFMARKIASNTSWVLAPSHSLICSTVWVNRPLPLKMSVSSAKKQKIRRAMKWFMPWRRSLVAQSGLLFSSSTYSLFRRPVAFTSMGLSLISSMVEMPASGRKKPKSPGKIGIRAGDGFTASQIFSLERLAVGGEDEPGFGFCGGRAVTQCRKGRAHGAGRAYRQMNMVALEHATGHIRRIAVAGAQA